MKEVESIYAGEDEFRDTIATVDRKGKRIWIYPKKPKGTFHRWRILVTVILLSILFAGPFISIQGRPLLLLNFFERRFVIFGQVFWPQDFVLLALLLIAFFVFIILFTVVFGRIWCGWLCPQTLFMEMVFRKLEYWIEGNANEQRKLAREPFNLHKTFRKAFKHFLFMLISLLIGHTTMAYLIGVDETLSIVSRPPSEHLAGFFGLIGFSGLFYGVFARFREQACIAVCPYGRLQGVFLGKSSIVVAYDWLRGEPRGKRKRDYVAGPAKGDCVDCKLCVHVCPTGIDIRNGTQMECVNCTACIDACDDVMIKIRKPAGLIRYASSHSIEQGIQRLLTGRVVAYAFVLLLLVSIFGFTLFTRSDLEITILKVPGTVYQRTADGFVTNLYSIEFVNKTSGAIPVDVKIESPRNVFLEKVGGENMIVPSDGISKGVYFIRMPASSISQYKTPVVIGVYRNGERIETVHTKFIGPAR